MALSATLRLIKRKQIDGAPGNKIPWVDSRRDNVGEEALKIKVWVLSYASSWCPDDSFPMWKMEATHLLPVSSSLPPTMKPSFSYNCSSPIMEIMEKKNSISQAQWDGTWAEKSWETNWNCTLFQRRIERETYCKTARHLVTSAARDGRVQMRWKRGATGTPDVHLGSIHYLFPACPNG